MIKVNAHILNYLSSDANINVIATLEDNFGSTPWEQTFEFNGKSESDDNGGVTIQPVNPGTLTPINR
ncbi:MULTISPECIES: hypothetical protein [Bacteroidales]|jgi:hypothetical protein|uniref:hypothetical protein n=3 Tax=Bacteroidia TaxID=200643 RepID=UPI001958D7FD|nr:MULTISPECIES: hypothetical protein [Bacteroidales]MCX4278805.1 hypothetical protein [Muribaculum sp.]